MPPASFLQPKSPTPILHAKKKLCGYQITEEKPPGVMRVTVDGLDGSAEEPQWEMIKVKPGKEGFARLQLTRGKQQIGMSHVQHVLFLDFWVFEIPTSHTECFCKHRRTTGLHFRNLTPCNLHKPHTLEKQVSSPAAKFASRSKSLSYSPP